MTKRMYSAPVLLVALLLTSCTTLRPPHPATVTITTADGTGADAYVRDGRYANSNFGKDIYLNAKDDGPSFARKIYLRFDLSSVTGPVESAALHLSVNLISAKGISPPTNHAFNVYGLRHDAEDRHWEETGITWKNAPANTDDGEALTDAAILLGQCSYAPAIRVGESMTFSSPELSAFLTGAAGKQATLIITDATRRSTGAIFATKDHAPSTPPTLVVRQ